MEIPADLLADALRGSDDLAAVGYAETSFWGGGLFSCLALINLGSVLCVQARSCHDAGGGNDP